MNTWTMPIVTEVCVGMEIISYDSADLDGGTELAIPGGGIGV